MLQGERPLTGILYLIERSGSDSELSLAERQALTSANLIVYDRSLDSLLGPLLPLASYAEQAPELQPAAEQPIFDRCLKFVLDGWSVAQLTQRRPGRERGSWLQDAAEQLATAGVSLDTPVQVLLDAADGEAVNIAARLHSAPAAIAGRDAPNGMMMVLGTAAAHTPAPHACAFAANGLAG